MLTATILLVIGVLGMVTGLWLLMRKRQYIAGALLLLAGLAVFFVGFAWPASVVFEGDPSELGDPPPQPAPVYEEGS